MSTFKNSILCHLDPEAIARLNLRPVDFEMGHEIEFPGNPIQNLFFLEAGMASMTTTFGDGSQVEVGMFGFESVIGVSALMGTKRSLNRVYTQIAGFGNRCSLHAAEQEFARGGTFHALALRYVQAQLIQAAQSAGCNAKHTMEQRLARWLLLCADRTDSNTFKLSQDFIGDMLGSTRPSVTIAAGTLKSEHLIDYTRGIIEILDVPGLKRRSCECYAVIKEHLDDAAAFDTSFTA